MGLPRKDDYFDWRIQGGPGGECGIWTWALRGELPHSSSGVHF